MTEPTRGELAEWRMSDLDTAASDLDEVRSSFLDDVAAAQSAPERADATWAGQAAEACRDRVAEEVDSSRKYAVELEEVADVLREVGRRLGYAKEATEQVAADIESDPHGLAVRDDWSVNISPMALIPTAQTEPEQVRQAMFQRQEQMDTAVRFLAEEDAACATLLREAFDQAAQAGRRLDQAAAFERATGRLPETLTDWLTAAMLDPTSEAEKYQGTAAEVVLGRIEPRPGRGVVTMELYIPDYSVFNTDPESAVSWPRRLSNYDLGDHRGPTTDSTVGNARVELVVDYETGLVVARQNPTVSEHGSLDVGVPHIAVQQLTSGDVRIGFDAGNPLAPPGSGHTHTVTGDVAITWDGDHPRLDGVRANYPAFEAYHHTADGTVSTLALGVAASPAGLSQFGPLVGLPFEHGIGDVRKLAPFEERPFVQFPWQEDRPGAAVLGKESDDVAVTPITPRRRRGRRRVQGSCHALVAGHPRLRGDGTAVDPGPVGCEDHRRLGPASLRAGNEGHRGVGSGDRRTVNRGPLCVAEARGRQP